MERFPLRDIDLDLVVRYSNTQELAAEVGQNPNRRNCANWSPTVNNPASSPSANHRASWNERSRCGGIGLYPLFVMVGLSADDYLADWRSGAAKVVVFVALFFLLTLAVSWQLLRSWQRQASAYQLLRNSEERLRLLAENATDTISRYDLTGVHLDVSNSCFRLIGYREDELLGRRISTLVHPDEQAALVSEREALINTAEPQIRVHRYRHKDGHYVWVESNVQAVRDDARRGGRLCRRQPRHHRAQEG